MNSLQSIHTIPQSPNWNSDKRRSSHKSKCERRAKPKIAPRPLRAVFQHFGSHSSPFHAFHYYQLQFSLFLQLASPRRRFVSPIPRPPPIEAARAPRPFPPRPFFYSTPASISTFLPLSLIFRPLPLEEPLAQLFSLFSPRPRAGIYPFQRLFNAAGMKLPEPNIAQARARAWFCHFSSGASREVDHLCFQLLARCSPSIFYVLSRTRWREVGKEFLFYEWSWINS